jgi:hypothetical protein
LLSQRARLLAYGCHNAENDPQLIFSDVDYAEATRAALRDPFVAEALSRVSLDFWMKRT